MSHRECRETTATGEQECLDQRSRSVAQASTQLRLPDSREPLGTSRRRDLRPRAHHRPRQDPQTQEGCLAQAPQPVRAHAAVSRRGHPLAVPPTGERHRYRRCAAEPGGRHRRVTGKDGSPCRIGARPNAVRWSEWSRRSSGSVRHVPGGARQTAWGLAVAAVWLGSSSCRYPASRPAMTSVEIPYTMGRNVYPAVPGVGSTGAATPGVRLEWDGSGLVGDGCVVAAGPQPGTPATPGTSAITSCRCASSKA